MRQALALLCLAVVTLAGCAYSPGEGKIALFDALELIEAAPDGAYLTDALAVHVNRAGEANWWELAYYDGNWTRMHVDANGIKENVIGNVIIMPSDVPLNVTRAIDSSQGVGHLVEQEAWVDDSWHLRQDDNASVPIWQLGAINSGGGATFIDPTGCIWHSNENTRTEIPLGTETAVFPGADVREKIVVPCPGIRLQVSVSIEGLSIDAHLTGPYGNIEPTDGCPRWQFTPGRGDYELVIAGDGPGIATYRYAYTTTSK